MPIWQKVITCIHDGLNDDFLAMRRSGINVNKYCLTNYDITKCSYPRQLQMTILQYAITLGSYNSQFFSVQLSGMLDQQFVTVNWFSVFLYHWNTLEIKYLSYIFGRCPHSLAAVSDWCFCNISVPSGDINKQTLSDDNMNMLLKTHCGLGMP